MANNVNKKEAWIDEVMSSTSGMNRHDAPTNLYEQIITRLNKPATVRTITMPVKQWAAAAILLLALNIGSVVYFNNQNGRAKNVNNSGLLSEMQLESTYNY